MFRDFEESPIAYQGELNAKKIYSWIDRASIPTIIDFSEKYMDVLFSGRNIMVLFSNDKTQAYHETYQDASKKLYGETLFVECGSKDGIQKNFADYIEWENTDSPMLLIISPGDSPRKYQFEGRFSVEAIEKFMNDYREGKLQEMWLNKS